MTLRPNGLGLAAEGEALGGELGRRARSRIWAAWLCGAVIVGTGLSASAPAGAVSPMAPGAPKVTAVTAGLSSVSVAFAKPASNGGSRISGYRVSCTSRNGGVPNSHQGFSSPVKVTGLTSGKTYTCTVAAINKFSVGPASAPSAPVVTLPTVPAAPTITKMTPGWHSMSIAFVDKNTGGAPISTYLVTCSVGYGKRSHQAFSSPVTIACVGGGVPYLCTVAAENRVGWSHASASSGQAVSLPITPGAPTITSAAAGFNSATVAFTPPASDGGARISNYRVICTSSNGGPSGAHQGFGSPITVAGIASGKTYTCTVAAINQVGTGPASGPSPPVVPISH
jgi:large repetitive protein